MKNLKAWMVKEGPWPQKGDPPKDDILQVVKDFCVKHPTDSIVICEKFASAARGNRYSRFTMELIGAIEGVCFSFEVPLIIMVNKQRLRYVPKAEEMLGIKHNSKPHHDRDDTSALSHMLAFINRCKATL